MKCHQISQLWFHFGHSTLSSQSIKIFLLIVDDNKAKDTIIQYLYQINLVCAKFCFSFNTSAAFYSMKYVFLYIKM